MSFLKKIMLAASLLLASSFASAAAYNLNLISSPSDSQNVQFTPATSTLGSVFGDKFYFSLASSSDWLVSQLLDQDADVSLLQFSVFNVLDQTATGNLASGSVGLDGNFRIVDLLLAGGEDYVVSVTGYLDSFTLSPGTPPSWNPGYTFTTMITPVPEASTIAMLLGGLGLVGFMARRRKAA